MKQEALSIEEQIAEHNRRIVKPVEFAKLLVPLVMMALALAVHMAIPSAEVEETGFYPGFIGVCMVVYGLFLIASCFVRGLRVKMLASAWHIAMLFIIFAWYDFLTAKANVDRSDIFVAPEAIVSSVPLNIDMVVKSVLGSLSLWAQGLFWGIVTGLITGVLIGWSYYGNYWLSPLLRIIGPVPPMAWLPIAQVIMPSTHLASVFIVAIAVWFPLSLNVSAAIRDVDKRLIDTARCLGGSSRFQLFHVAIPSSLPSVFTGLFMGISASFGALVFAEMLGVKAGLGWYIMAAKGLFAWSRVLSSVVIFIVVFFAIIWALFKIRDHFLKWQKGTIRW